MERILKRIEKNKRTRMEKYKQSEPDEDQQDGGEIELKQIEESKNAEGQLSDRGKSKNFEAFRKVNEFKAKGMI